MLNCPFKAHKVCWDFSPYLPFVLSSYKLLSLFSCLFSCHHDDLTVVSAVICSVCMMYVKVFSLYIFPALTAKSPKASPVTHSCSYLLSTLSSSSHVASGLKKCIFECLPTIFSSRYFSVSAETPTISTTHTCTQPPPAPLPLCINATQPQIMVSRLWS